MNSKKGQIMLITLIVLMIVAIVIIGLVVLIQRDTEQVETSRAYEQIANSAEQTINEYVRTYGQLDFALKNLPGSKCDKKTDSEKPYDDVYICEESDSDFSQQVVEREVEVRDTHDIDDLTLIKDQMYTVRLAEDSSTKGYFNSLDIRWTNDVVLEFTIYYEDLSSSNFYLVKDIFDAHGVFDQFIGDDPINNSPSNPGDPFKHVLNFQVDDPSNTTNTTKITISDYFSTLPGPITNYVPRFLIITPRSRVSGVTTLSIIPSDKSTYPYQKEIFNL
ncbi:MAG: hypothetical protein Q9M91_01275 [Candidatus Dojkabacteria bacterium]|nr:hypothetical protein [Candidatus Dojkabacteria bacterium]